MVNSLARKWRVQVTADTTLSSGWTEVHGLTDVAPVVTPNNEDASDYDTNGWSAVEPTMQSWVLTASLNRIYGTGLVYDAGQELIRTAIGQFAAAARIGVRWFDRFGGPEANSGVAIPTWKASSTAVKNLEVVQVTLTGTDVALNQNITNPYTTSLVPVINAVSPTSPVPGTGTPVAISGSNFTGVVATTGVKFGGTNATSFEFVNDQLIVAVLPSGSAGTTAVVVTNATGASASFNIARGV